MRIKRLIKGFRLFVSDRFFLKQHRAQKRISQSLLIVKTDAIGDYILFRNFIEVIRKSKKYAHHSITLCGNHIWRDIAEAYDKDFVNDFIWVDNKKFMNEMAYRHQIMSEVYERGFETVFHPTYSREFLIGDSLVSASNAKFRVGCKGNKASEIPLLKAIGNSFYSEWLEEDHAVIFEFDRNRNAVSKFLDEPVLISQPYFSGKRFDSAKMKYAVIFHGAGETQKRWVSQRFATVAKWIANELSMSIFICGSEQDKNSAEEIIQLANVPNMTNKCGETSLTQLIEIMKEASLLITTDSSALHIGAATKTPTVCVLNGRHYGRFAPYPNTTNIFCIYPDRMQALIESDKAKAIALTERNAIDTMESISAEQVIKQLISLVNEGIINR